MNHFEQCSYTIAPMSDSVPVPCERPAVRHVIFTEDSHRQMFYCAGHWKSVADLPMVQKAQVEDLVEDRC